MIELPSGIYKITNSINGKVYVGQTKDLASRWDSHLSALIRKDHANYRLQEDCNKYSPYCFKFKVLETCSISSLRDREQYWIDYHGGYRSDGMYNLLDNKSVSQEVIEKRRAGMVGKERSEEYRKRRSLEMMGNKRNLGKKLSDETKRKIGDNSKEKLTGKKQSQGTKDKRSESLRKYWRDVKEGRITR